MQNPLAPFLYAVSTLHCTTVSLAHVGAGIGTCRRVAETPLHRVLEIRG